MITNLRLVAALILVPAAAFCVEQGPRYAPLAAPPFPAASPTLPTSIRFAIETNPAVWGAEGIPPGLFLLGKADSYGPIAKHLPLDFEQRLDRVLVASEVDPAKLASLAAEFRAAHAKGQPEAVAFVEEELRRAFRAAGRGEISAAELQELETAMGSYLMYGPGLSRNWFERRACRFSRTGPVSRCSRSPTS